MNLQAKPPSLVCGHARDIKRERERETESVGWEVVGISVFSGALTLAFYVLSNPMLLRNQSYNK